MNPPRIDLRPGVTEPVILLISRRAIEHMDVASVVKPLKILLATREDTRLYRGQMSLVVDGYDEDPRALVDIVEVRDFLRAFSAAWPYWAYFFNQVDDSIIILGSCVCGAEYPGGGTVQIDAEKLKSFLLDGLNCVNELFDKHGFPESENALLSQGLLEVISQAGLMR
jgi:hypothetical protein